MTKNALIFVTFLIVASLSYASSNEGPKRFYQIPEFSFDDALSGKTIRKQDLKGQMAIISFVFTNCSHVCPFIMGNMANLQKKYADANDVKLVSVTTDPRRDSAPVFKKYGEKFSAKSGKWWFFTGKPEEIVSFITGGFKLPISLESPDIHSEKIALVDEQGWVRGYFNSSSKEELKRLDLAMENLRTEMKNASPGKSGKS